MATGEQLTGDPDLVCTPPSPTTPVLSIVGYVILSCRTAHGALDWPARYAPLLNEGLHVESVADERQTVCRFSAVDAFDSFLHREPRQVMETLAAGAVVTLRRLATGPVEPARVIFRHAAPPSIAEHLRILGPAVRFNQSEDAVIYDTHVRCRRRSFPGRPHSARGLAGDARRRLDALAERGGEERTCVTAARFTPAGCCCSRRLRLNSR